MFIIFWKIQEVQVSLKPWTLWGDLKILVVRFHYGICGLYNGG